MTDKLCKDCKWTGKPSWLERLVMGNRFARCFNPKTLGPRDIGVTLIDGSSRRPDDYLYCSVARNDYNGLSTNCGSEGRFWEAK